MQISVWLLRKLRQENPREGSALDESCSNPINEISEENGVETGINFLMLSIY